MVSAFVPWMAMLGVGPFRNQDDPAHWSTEQWIVWRDAQIKHIFTPTYDAGKEMVLLRDDVVDRSAEAYRFVVPLLESPEFLQDPARGKALGNFISFIKAQNWMAVTDSHGKETNTLGMDISDREYWEYVRPYVTFPELLRRQDFLKYMSRPETYKSAVEMIEAHNKELPDDQKWIVYPFRAQFILSADKMTYGRILVLVPNVSMPDGKLLDQWILFAVTTPDMPQDTPIRSVSVVAVLRDPATPGKHRAFLSDFLRDADKKTGQIELHPNFLLFPNPSKNCYDCHKSAVLPLQPKVAYRFDTNRRLIADTNGVGPIPAMVNSKIEEYGKPDFGHLNTSAYGPSIGQADKERGDDFLREATQGLNLSGESFDRIREAMRCSVCHEGFAKVNYMIGVKTDRDIKSFEAKTNMVQAYVEKGLMPPGNTLSDIERKALAKCVMKSYFDPKTGSGDLIDWLKGN